MAAKLQKKDHKNCTFLWSIAFVVIKNKPYLLLFNLICLYIPNRSRLTVLKHFLT